MDRKCRGIDQAGCPAPSRTGWRQLGGLWFPSLPCVDERVGWGGGAVGRGVKPGRRWQLPVTSRTPEGRDRRRSKDTIKRGGGTVLKKNMIRPHMLTHQSRFFESPFIRFIFLRCQTQALTCQKSDLKVPYEVKLT